MQGKSQLTAWAGQGDGLTEGASSRYRRSANSDSVSSFTVVGPYRLLCYNNNFIISSSSEPLDDQSYTACKQQSTVIGMSREYSRD